MYNFSSIKFQKASLEHKNSLFSWFEEPHIKESWDNSQNHRDDIFIFMKGRKEPSPYYDGIFDYWIGFINDEPYCLIMTSEIIPTEPNLLDSWKAHLSKDGKTFSFDFMIGNKKYLGKGLAAPTLQAFAKFIYEVVDSSVDTFVIDPEEANVKAKHVYEKAGFRTVAQFKRDCQDRKNVNHFLMIKTVFSVENASEDTKEEMIQFLKNHEDYCLFMLGNLEAHGYKMTEAPNSGNFKLIRKFNDVVGVFCVAKRGTLLVQADIDKRIFRCILNSFQEENITIKGTIGELNLCRSLWQFLKVNQVIRKETFASKEILYNLILSNQSYPKDERVKLLKASDFLDWKGLNDEYMREQMFPNELSEEQLRIQFLWKVEQRIIWGLFLDNQLTTVAELNAKTSDLGQVGGVYTSPYYRNRGLATALMRQLIMDVKNIHGISKIIIFTDEGNRAARKVYESLGVNHIGYFTLLFGE